jgi:hypothetical protein
MRARAAKMAKNLCVRTTCLLQGIREDREPPVIQRAFWQLSLVVGGLGEADHQPVVPGQDAKSDGDEEEGVTEDAVEQPDWRLQLLEISAGKVQKGQ